MGLHMPVKDFVSLDQVNEVCLAKDTNALRELGDALDAAIKTDSLEAVSLFHAAITSLGLTPIVPKETSAVDSESTCSGGAEEDSVEECPSPEKIAEQERKEAERERQRQEQEKKRLEQEEIKKAEAERNAAIKAEERKKREEQRLKLERAAEAKRRDQEKKEREKA